MMVHKCPYLSQFSSLAHGFFEANPYILTTQRDQAMKEMTGFPCPLITLKQVHGNKVLRLTEWGNEKKEGDGLVTNIRRIALGILTADCGPVLFYDPIAAVIGACHAGWRGAKGEILRATLTALEEIGAKRSQIYATLGPTIQQKNYEVGPEFPDLINEPYETYFYPSKKRGHHYFNLPRYIFEQLTREGIRKVFDIKRDTFSENFASRRRCLTLTNQVHKFHNLSAIAIL